MTIRVTGVNETMRVLAEFDREYYEAVRGDMVQALQPIVTDARSMYPDQPLSGWGPWRASGLNPTKTGARGTAAGRNLSYSGSSVRSRVRADVSRKSRFAGGTRIRNIAGVTQWSPAGVILELAGTRTGSAFADNVDADLGAFAAPDPLGGRILPRAARRNLKAVQAELGRIIDNATTRAQRKLDAAGGVLIK